MSKKTVCQVTGCTEPPVRGAYALPKKGDATKIPFAILCATHGQRALELGAKKMGWRPRPT